MKNFIEKNTNVPPLKEVRRIKDECRVGSAKFFHWLNNTIMEGSRFESNGKKYRILDPLIVKDNQKLPTLKIEDECGGIMELSPNEIVDLVGEKEFSYNIDRN